MRQPRDYGEPTPALKRPEPDLPLAEKIWCAVIVTLLVIGAVWVSVIVGRHS
jgi:hypothetical protein